MSISALLLALIAIFIAAKVFGELAERLGQPAVLGELVGGVIVGVSGLRFVDPHDVTLHLLSELGHLKEPESQVILGAAVVDDIIGLVLLTLCGTLAGGGELTTLSVLKVVVIAFGFVILAIVIGSKLAPFLIRLIDRIDVVRGLFFASLVFAFLLRSHTDGDRDDVHHADRVAAD